MADKASQQLTDYKAKQQSVPRATVGSGAPIGTKTASTTAGPRGPLLHEDFAYHDEMAHFDHERIPERVVHAKGAGAHGVFEVTHDITDLCKAKIFAAVGQKTPMFLRFSTVGGESGSADTARDPRGFAMKFYTTEGNWDLVGNNTPIFFIRDPVLFPSFIHTQKRNPKTHLKDADMFWDFISLRPETTHQVSFLFSDRGTPDGYRHMNGYGSHTFKLVNGQGEAVYCKFHCKTNQGIKNLPTAKADSLAGSDPDYSIRDLFNAIETGDFPSWSFFIQVMTMSEAETCPFNPFDLTKVWPQGEYPLKAVGRFTLNRNAENYFAEVEQSAFSPSHMVPGIEPSPDKMLQGRLFSYPDTHRHRLGVNYQQIPINCPYRCQEHSYQRDGPATVNTNQKGAPNYYPNSFSGPEPDKACLESTYKITAAEVGRVETGQEDNFSQATVFWTKVLTDQGRLNLVNNIAGHLKNAKRFIQVRAVGNFAQVHPDFGGRLEQALGIAVKM